MHNKNEKVIVDYYNLGLSKIMISNLNAIKNEALEIINSNEDISNNIESLINYYVDIIIKEGVNVTKKKLSLNKITKIDDTYDELSELYKYGNLSHLMKYINDTKEKNQIVNMIIFYCIKLYKHSQLIEFKLNQVNNVDLISKNNCCALCNTKSKFDNTVDELIQDIHPFCKDEYSLFVNEKDIRSFINKLKIMIPERILDIDIEFVDNIDSDNILTENENQKMKLNEISENIISYKNDRVMIKKFTKDIYHILLLNIFDFNFNDEVLNWFENKYIDMIKEKAILNDIVMYKKPFISFMAEISSGNYLTECIIYYILDGTALHNIDQEAYSYIKSNIFNNLEFR